MTSAPADASLRVLALVGASADARILLQVLSEDGLAARALPSCDELLEELRQGVGTLILTEETVTGPTFSRLSAVLADEPPWSDIPLILLTRPGRSASVIRVLSALDSIANVTIIERPVNRATLISALRVAARARLRQYEMREQLAERLEMLERERLLRDEAERSSQSKDEFLATLSHELRTPLSAVLGWTQLVRPRVDPATEVGEAFAVIERNAQMQSQLIDDLLDMSRIIAGKVSLNLAEVDLCALVASAVESARPTADRKGVRLEEPSPAPPSRVRADAERLTQVLWNVLGNAVKFTPTGGRVSVEIERVDANALARAGNSSAADDERCGAVQIIVSDTGAGIAPKDLAAIFERFRQVDSSSTRRHGGLGLGLSIAKSLVQLHGGSIEARSAGPGRGSTFVITLPLLEASDPVVRSEDKSNRLVRGASLTGVRVLVVDDERDARELTRRVIEQCGAVVTTAESASEGLASIQVALPDIIVSDIGMPAEDGYLFLQRVRALGPDSGGRVPAIALTAYASQRDEVRAREANYAAHLGKPFDAETLVETIQRLVGRDGSRAARAPSRA